MTSSVFLDIAGTRPFMGYRATRVFGSLDGLRALSIISVVWFHSTNEWPALPLLRRGFLGVDFFFVISGFLISTLLLRERRNTGDISLRDFYVRRFLRIAPAYWVMLLFVALVAYLKPGAESAGIKHDLPFAVLYVSNLVPMASLLSITWSLSTEEQFYMIVPALQTYVPHLFAVLLLPLAYIAATLPAFGMFPSIHMPDFFRQTTFGPILLGVALAYALDRANGRVSVLKWLLHPLSPLAALALVAIACCYPGPDISGWPRCAIQWSLVLLLASCVVREGHVLTRPLTWWPVRRIGVVSYGIYLYHLIVFSPVSHLLSRAGVESKYALAAGVLGASWLLAELSYHFVERRFLKLKVRFSVGAQSL